MAMIAPPLFLKTQYEGKEQSAEFREQGQFNFILSNYANPFGMAKDNGLRERLREYPPTDLNIELKDTWKSSFYAMHDLEKESGARCAHLCIVMACGLLSNQGNYTEREIARIPGSFEVSFLAAKIENKPFAPGGLATWEFNPTEGLTPNRVKKVLKDHCKVNAFFFRRIYENINDITTYFYCIN